MLKNDFSMTNRYSLATKEFRELEGAKKNVLYKKRRGGSCRQAARDLQIPESTLRGQCKAAAKGRDPGRNGRPPALTEEEQDAFIDLIELKIENKETIHYPEAIVLVSISISFFQTLWDELILKFRPEV